MRQNKILIVFFFASLWGVIEAGLGGFLYGKHLPFSSAPLTIGGLMVLTIARAYLPYRGSSTLIGSIAMLYKFFNAPFFACHLLAIFLLGLSYDLLFGLFKQRSKALFGVCAAYLGYLLFSLTITYVFRYHYWIDEGLPRIIRYIGGSGSLAALGSFFAVPLAFRISSKLSRLSLNPFELRFRFAPVSLSFITIVLWSLSLTRSF